MSSNSSLNFTPIQVLEVDLSKPLPTIDGYNKQTDRRYTQAWLFARLQGQPVGTVELKVERGLTPDQVAEQIWKTLGADIAAQVRDCGISDIPTSLTGVGLSLPQPGTSDNEPTPLVSIVIATRERAEQLAICLRTIATLDYPCYEIIVVDNAPKTNATEDVIKRDFGDLHNLRYVREDQPGLSIARNRGLAEAKGEIVAITDDDVRVDSRWLRALVRVFDSTDNVGCVTGLIMPSELESASQVWFEQYGGYSRGFRRRIYDLKQNRPHDFLFPYSAGKFGSGCNMAFKTDVLQKLGGFDPAMGAGSLSTGGEDLAIFFSVITSNYRLVYEPEAIVYHPHPREYNQVRRQVYNYGIGFTAFITWTIFERPPRIFELFSKLPYGLYKIFSPKAPKSRNKQRDYPHELTILELRGYCYGPIAYLRSWWKTHKAATMPKKV